MNIRPLKREEAKAVRWQISDPRYRVDFWRHLTDKLPDTPPEKLYQRVGMQVISQVGPLGSRT